MEKREPKIYVACLAAYNHGYLHGEWIDANQDEEDIREEIQMMLKESPVKHLECCEEWAIHDHEDFHPISISEYENLSTIAELGQAIAEHGEAIAAYYGYYGSLENFEDYYQGEYKSEEDFTYEQFEQSGQLETIEKAGLNSFYIDFKAMARDWFIDSFFSVELGYEKVLVFSR